MNTQIADSIRDICKKHKAKTDGLLLAGEDIDIDGLQHISKLLNIPAGTEIIAFCKDSTFSSKIEKQKKGIAICDTGVFWLDEPDQMRFSFVTFAELRELTFIVGGFLVGVVFNNGKRIEVVNFVEIGKKPFAALLTDISTFVLSEFYDINAPKPLSKTHKGYAECQPTQAKSVAVELDKLEFCTLYYGQPSTETSYLLPGFNHLSELILDATDNVIRKHAVSGLTTIKQIGKNFIGLNKSKDIYSSLLQTEILVTDSRIAFLNTAWKPAGSWTGYNISGMIAAGVLNTIEGALTPRKGKALHGHVRYEWIRGISYSGKKENNLYIEYSDTMLYTYRIHFEFYEGYGYAKQLANDLLHLICTYRLAMTDVKDAQCIEFFRHYSNPTNKISAIQGKKYDFGIALPNSYPAPYGEAYHPYALV